MTAHDDFKYHRVVKNNCRSKAGNAYLLIKRLLDVLIAGTVLLFIFPLIILFGILIELESEGSCIYSQVRVGKDGRPFKIYKLRSMYMDAEKNGPQWARKNDPRITRVGSFIRRNRIDETPQLINIIKGDMSIVGPRPERQCFIDEFIKEIPEYNERLAVKPGLTGWAQINGGYELSPKEKLEKDLYYIENQSILLDLKIMLRTMIIVLYGYGAR